MTIRENTLKYLREAGWYEGRKIDITEIVKYLEGYGYEVFEPVKRFLEEFGMLTIRIPDDCEFSNYKYNEHHTNVMEAIDWPYSDGVFEDVEKYAGERLVPVGMIHNENLWLFVSESGKLCSDMKLLGDTFMEGWDCLINGIPGKLW